MNNKTYIIIGGVVLVLLFGYFLVKGQSYPAVEAPREVVPTQEVVQQPNPTVAVAVPTGATVDYLDSGFVPKIITVSVGTKVVWKNTGDKPMWVASAVHPTHQVLPGFDQLTSIGKGGAYAYVFTQQGTWRYHNHLAPADTGTITVE